MQDLAAVIIWYNPQNVGIEKIQSNINSYSNYFSKIYIIDNSKESNKNLADCINNSEYIQNYNINGIAGAQNIGCERALNDGYKWIMTLDQDSYFESNQIKKYIDLFNEYLLSDTSIKSFAPKILNQSKSIAITKLIRFYLLSPLKKVVLGKHYKIKTDSKNSKEIESPLEVIASGNIISLEVWKEIGKFDNFLFIDEVDHDFCHRIIAENYKIIKFNNVYLSHSLGTKTISLFEKHTGNYNNFRLYYIFRNILIERFRYPCYKKNYNLRLRYYLFDNIINSIHPISHLYIFLKAVKDFYKYKSKNYKLVELLPWKEFLDVHLKKDTGLFPKYLAFKYQLPYEIVYMDSLPEKNTKLNILDRYGKIQRLPSINVQQDNYLPNPFSDFKNWKKFIKPFIKYIWKNRKKNTHYILFHNIDNTIVLAFFIKLFNRKAKIWLKMDANPDSLKTFIQNLHLHGGLKSKLRISIYRKIYKSIDLLSTETEETFSILKSDSFFSKLNIQKIPNGIENYPKFSEFQHKDNILISVARFGTKQKNTELLLSSLEKVDLKNWKIYLIGPIEKYEQDFQSYINNFFSKHPDLQDKIIFTDNINDKKILDDYYARAKIFILPSRMESFGISSLEAASHLNYLILTDVGAARDLIPDESYGYILPESKQTEQNEEIIQVKLTEKLNRIIQENDRIDFKIQERYNFYKKFLMSNIVNEKYFSKFFNSVNDIAIKQVGL